MMETGTATGRNERRIFLFLIILPFILLPILCLDAGISGDEPVHHEQAVNVHRYFASGGKDLSPVDTPITFLKYYGQSIDNFAEWLNRILGIEQPYLVRHLVNSLAGALTILLAAFVAVELAGYRAGILTILFLLLSPVFLGHTYNNLKDIPFALGYAGAVYFLVRFLKQLPSIRWGWLAGIAGATGFAISVRIGGLVILPIVAAFTGIQAYLRMPSEREGRLRFFLLLAAGFAGMAVLSCFLGIINWPYALRDPIRHPLESLATMTHYIVSIRQLFEGQLWWSEDLPWHYAPKYFLLTTPAVILAGLAYGWKSYRRSDPVPFLLILFCALFPLFWVIIVNANLYGNIRHLLFIYPMLVVLSAAGWIQFLKRLQKPLLQGLSLGILGVGLAGPLIHTIRNHPVEYVWFNRISGGVKAAYPRYETDYYFHSLGPAVRWLGREILAKPGGDTLVLASNFPLEPFLRPTYANPTVYTTWHEKGCADWDYGLFVNAYLGPGGLAGKQLPHGSIVHSVNVDGLPMCLVIRRPGQEDLEGCRLFAEQEYDRAAALLRTATIKDPGNETAWLYLGWSLRKSGQIEESNLAAEQLLHIWPESDQARELLIWNLLDRRQFDKARELAAELTRLNPKYPAAASLGKTAADSAAANPSR